LGHKILILGGDGYIGWPLSLRLASLGNDVRIVDDLSRRTFDSKHGFKSNIAHSWQRESVSGIKYHNVNLIHSNIGDILKRYKPDIVIHAAGQRSAPVSHTSRYKQTTFLNNIIMLNALESIKEVNRDIRLIHFGSMGVYNSYSESVGHDTIGNLLPMAPKSLYHLTKCHDLLTLEFYSRTYGLDITEIHSGTAWGSQTAETSSHPFLRNRLDYDYYYGTFINRFMCQAAIGEPITVYGDGVSEKSIIHIEDSIINLVEIINKKHNTQTIKIRNHYTELITPMIAADRVNSVYGLGINSVFDNRLEATTQYNPVSSHSIIQSKTIYDDLIAEFDNIDAANISKKQMKIQNHKW